MTPLAALVLALLLPGFTPLQAGAGGGQVLSGVFPGTSGRGTSTSRPVSARTQRIPSSTSCTGCRARREFLDGTQLPEWADAQISAGSIRPFIGVLPAAGSTTATTANGPAPGRPPSSSRVVPCRRPSADDPGTLGPGAGRAVGGRLRRDRHRPAEPARLRSARVVERVLRAAPRWPVQSTRIPATLTANDPAFLAGLAPGALRRLGTRFFVSSGPAHSHWFRADPALRARVDVARTRLAPAARLLGTRGVARPAGRRIGMGAPAVGAVVEVPAA